MRRIALMFCVLAWTATVWGADDEAGFKSIFDGQSLNGWKAWPGDEGFWKVVDGTIVGESTAENPCQHNTFLRWDQGTVDDFELRLQFRISGSDAANSGIQFRGVQREDGHVIGYQADIDRAGNWLGCLYDEAQRGVLATRGQKVTVLPEGQERQIEQIADAAELLKQARIDDWNDYSIKAQGNVITLSVNGHQTVQITDRDPAGLDLTGVLALQLHSGPPMKIEWKNLRIKRFPLTDGRKKIVFIAGRPSHGYMSHEHNAGCLLLAEKLNAAARNDGLPVLATVYRSGWPTDPTALDNADCVVSYCDGGGGHYLNDRLAEFDHLVNGRHVGLVCIHYAVETTIGDCGAHFLKWLGGYFEPNWSVNPHWTAKFDNLPQHPITSGVGTIEVNDEWYYHMRFVPEMAGVTPILSALPPRETLNRGDGPHSGNPAVREAVLERKETQHVAWAYERPEGRGRGFGFTGGHFHKNWQHDEFRKLVLNAIVWAAQGEVPAAGVASTTPTDEEMELNQDEPKPGSAEAKPQPKPAPKLASADVKPAYSSKVVTPQTPGHAVEIDVDITGAKSLWLVVTDGGNGFACDWADWMEPRLSGVSGESKLTDMKWKTASAGHGEVRSGMNSGGDALRVDGKPVAYGIGTHANSIVEYELPANHTFTRFKAHGGLDNGGTGQGGCGAATSVQFHVFTARPSAAFLAANTSGGGGGGGPIDHGIEHAIEQLDVHPELAAAVFAAEPMMTNPASIDVDHQGRVWVCEAINYRAFANKDVIGDQAKEGDRILVLQDVNGDGQADSSRVFHQGHDVDSAHGILVLPTPSGKGLRALVSALDSVFYLIDEDGDLKSDRKELLFTGIDGTQHDHGIHAVHFGADGKLYFNFGNAGRRIKDKSGNTIVDKMGNEVHDHRKPYQEGMVFRCNLDGSEFETLGWNFRNNWEVCVDSFGTMWQSDNDDDGNRGVRINYVMEYGNYGYKDEFTGAGWKDPRTNMETEVPLQHWHLNDPGVMPNLLQTGAGAPTGICIYEGDLLPMFKGAILHCDAGPNICRAYVTRSAGAGYTAEIVNILDGARNKWFRPSDVCVAPDGSVFVADWYDPGVGGHRMQDAAHGRIFRVSPKGDASSTYQLPQVDVSTPAGALAALKSPNMCLRYLGWSALHSMGEEAVPVLEQLWNSDDAMMQARALGLLVKLNLGKETTLKYLTAGVTSPNADIRCASIRLARQLGGVIEPKDIAESVKLDDPSPAVRREILIGVRELFHLGGDTEDLVGAWVALALQYDGQDRWYLEALGLAAEGHWNEIMSAYVATRPDMTLKATRDIIWRSRAPQTPELLSQLISHPGTPGEEIPRYLRAYDFLSGEAKNASILQLTFVKLGDAARTAFINSEALNRIGGFDINSRPELKETLLNTLDAARGTSQYVQLVDKFRVSDRYADLLGMAQSQPNSQLAVDSIKVLLAQGQQSQIKEALRHENREIAMATVEALTTAQDGRSVGLLMMSAKDDQLSPETRRAAIKGLGGIRNGAEELKKLAESGQYDPILTQALTAALHTAPWPEIKEFAARQFPLPPGKDARPLPPIGALAAMTGDVANGRIVFNTLGTCNKCHQVNGIGLEIGPNLSEIGKKLTKEALLESILYPSAAISHNYESWLIQTADGQTVTGLLVSETDAELQIKDEKGIIRKVAVENIEGKKKQDISLMPGDVQKLVTQQELLDIVEYLTTLKERKL